MKFTNRAYNSIDVDYLNNILYKSSSNKNKLINEESYYKNIELMGIIQCLFPRVIDGWQLQNNNYCLAMEYYAYKNMFDELVLTNTFYNVDVDVWRQVAEKILATLTVLKDFKIGTITAQQRVYNLKQMYMTKTENEFNSLIKTPFFAKLNDEKYLVINNTVCLNFKYIWNEIKNVVEKELCTSNTEFTCIHGDMCFSNILIGNVDKNITLKFIDPRGSFGDIVGIYGDYLYDIAKLFHSFEGGYEYIINDMFDLKQDSDNHTFYYSYKADITNILTDIFCTYFSEDDIRKARLIEGLIFISMCARHYDSLDRQIVMYLTGIKLLNSSLREYGLKYE
jgi:hypothetical protein